MGDVPGVSAGHLGSHLRTVQMETLASAPIWRRGSFEIGKGILSHARDLLRGPSPYAPAPIFDAGREVAVGPLACGEGR
jgi:hypothetical protein